MKKLALVIAMCLVAQSSWAFGLFNRNKSAAIAASPPAGNTIVPAIPEPETYVLLLTGLGLVAWVARKRKK